MARYPGGPSHRLSSRAARLLLAAIFALGVVALAPRGASATQRAAFVDTGTVTLVTNTSPSDIDPANDEVAGSDQIARNVAEPLVAPDGTSITKFKPVLATSWSSNADQSVWTFHLRHNVMFHTGRCCMTADDVKYSLARTVYANLTNVFLLSRFMTNPNKQIKIVDPYTVEFDLGRSQPLFVDGLSSLYGSLILDARALRAHVTKSDPYAHLWATDHDAGTGPYEIQSWQHGNQVVLTRFPQYWGGWSGRHFSKAIIRTVPENATRRELLERGVADITFQLTPEDYQALAKEKQVKLVAPYGTEVEYIYMTEAGPLASPYARQALSYAFPYNAYINGYYRGYAKRSYGCLPSTMLGYDPNQFHYQTDLNKARALLAKAGVKPGTTLTYVSYDAYKTAGLFLQAQLQQLGITVKTQILDESIFTSDYYYGSQAPSKRPNLMAFGWWPDFNDPYDECNILLNSAAAGPNGANTGYYHNSTVDALLAKMKTAGGEELTSLSDQMQESAALNPPAIWIDEPEQVTVLSRSLQGYVFNPVELQTYDFYSMYRA
jgi:peptide/nickel transport system substrate-binding protein